MSCTTCVKYTCLNFCQHRHGQRIWFAPRLLRDRITPQKREQSYADALAECRSTHGQDGDDVQHQHVHVPCRKNTEESSSIACSHTSRAEYFARAQSRPRDGLEKCFKNARLSDGMRVHTLVTEVDSIWIFL